MRALAAGLFGLLVSAAAHAKDASVCIAAKDSSEVDRQTVTRSVLRWVAAQRLDVVETCGGDPSSFDVSVRVVLACPRETCALDMTVSDRKGERAESSFVPRDSLKTVGQTVAEMIDPSPYSGPRATRRTALISAGWATFGGGWALQAGLMAQTCEWDSVLTSTRACGGRVGYSAIPLVGGFITMATGTPRRYESVGWTAAGLGTAFQIAGLTTAIVGHAMNGHKERRVTVHPYGGAESVGLVVSGRL